MLKSVTRGALKAFVRKDLRVRVPLPALLLSSLLIESAIDAEGFESEAGDYACKRYRNFLASDVKQR